MVALAPPTVALTPVMSALLVQEGKALAVNRSAGAVERMDQEQIEGHGRGDVGRRGGGNARYRWSENGGSGT